MPEDKTSNSKPIPSQQPEHGVSGRQHKKGTEHIAQDAVAPECDLPSERPAEHGGQAGLEPTRYGDWEKKGRCTDF